MPSDSTQAQTITPGPKTTGLHDPRTNLGPLTTIFEPPEECSTCYMNNNYDLEWFYQGCHMYASDCASRRPCMPGAQPATSGNLQGFYSPGIYCPRDWVTALNVGSQYPSLYNSLLPGENAALCCPKGMELRFWDTPSLQYDGRPFDSPALCAISFDSDQHHTGLTICYPDRPDPTQPMIYSATTGTYWSIAPAIQINWRDSDRPTTQTLSTSTNPVTQSTVSSSLPFPSSTTSEPSATLTASATSEPQGFSSSHLAGVAVGSVFGTLICAILAFFLIRHMRRRRRCGSDEKVVVDTENTLSGHGAAELNATGEGISKYELPLPSSPVELQGSVPPVIQGKKQAATAPLPDAGELDRKGRGAESRETEFPVPAW